MSLGQQKRSVQLQAQVEALVLCIKQGNLLDNFSFDVSIACFNTNIRTAACMVLLDNACLDFQKNYFRYERHDNRNRNWTSFLCRHVDSHILQKIYAAVAHVHDSWINDLPANYGSVKAIPTDLDLYLFAISRSLGNTRLMLLHLQRSQKRIDKYATEMLPPFMEALRLDMWQRYKKAAACVCPFPLHCDGCVEGRCVHAGVGGGRVNMRKDANLPYTAAHAMLSSKQELMQHHVDLFAPGVCFAPYLHSALKLEMRKAGVRSAYSLATRLVVSRTFSGNLVAGSASSEKSRRLVPRQNAWKTQAKKCTTLLV